MKTLAKILPIWFVIAAGSLILAVLALPGTASAEMSTSVFAGPRTTDLVYHLSNGSNPTKTVTGTEYGLTLGYSPWNTLPASFGLITASYVLNSSSLSNSLAEDDLGSDLKYFGISSNGSNTGLIYGPQVAVWYPFTYVQPYIRLGQMYGTETNNLASESATLSNVSPSRVISATHKDTFDVATNFFSLGFALSPITILRMNHDRRFPILALDRHIYTFAIFGEYSLETGTRTLTATSRSTSNSSAGASTTTRSNKINPKEITSQQSQSSIIRFGLEYRF